MVPNVWTFQVLEFYVISNCFIYLFFSIFYFKNQPTVFKQIFPQREFLLQFSSPSLICLHFAILWVVTPLKHPFLRLLFVMKNGNPLRMDGILILLRFYCDYLDRPQRKAWSLPTSCNGSWFDNWWCTSTRHKPSIVILADTWGILCTATSSLLYLVCAYLLFIY